MKFIVKVKLVENRVNKTVGKVMEVKVTTQYKIPGITFAMRSNVLENQPNHEPDRLPSEALARERERAGVSLQANTLVAVIAVIAVSAVVVVVLLLLPLLVVIADSKPLDEVIKFPATKVSRVSVSVEGEGEVSGSILEWK